MISLLAWICLVSPTIVASTFCIVTTLITKKSTAPTTAVVPVDQHTFLKKGLISQVNDNNISHDITTVAISEEFARLTKLTTKSVCYSLTRDFSNDARILKLSTDFKKTPHTFTSNSHKFNTTKQTCGADSCFCDFADIQVDYTKHIKIKPYKINCFVSSVSDNSFFKNMNLCAFIKNILKTVNNEEVCMQLQVRANLLGLDFKTFINKTLPPFNLVDDEIFSTKNKVYTQFNSVENSSLTYTDDVYKKLQESSICSTVSEAYIKKLRFNSLQGMITKSDKFNLSSYVSNVDLITDVKQSVALSNYLKLYLDNMTKLFAELITERDILRDSVTIINGELVIRNDYTNQVRSLKQCSELALLSDKYFDHIKECFLIEMEYNSPFKNFNWDYVIDVKNLSDVTLLLKKILSCQVKDLEAVKSFIITDICKDDFSEMLGSYDYVADYPRPKGLYDQVELQVNSVKRLLFYKDKVILDNYTGFQESEVFSFELDLAECLNQFKDRMREAFKKVRQTATIDSRLYEYDLVLPSNILIYPPETDRFTHWARNTFCFETSAHYNAVRRFLFSGVDASRKNLIEAGNTEFSFDTSKPYFLLKLGFDNYNDSVFSKVYTLPGHFPTTIIFIHSGNMDGASFTGNRVFLCNEFYRAGAEFWFNNLVTDYTNGENDIFKGVNNVTVCREALNKALNKLEYKFMFDGFIEFFRKEMVVYING